MLLKINSLTSFQGLTTNHLKRGLKNELIHLNKSISFCKMMLMLGCTNFEPAVISTAILGFCRLRLPKGLCPNRSWLAGIQTT